MSMYSNKFVACIKAAGKVLSDKNNTVKIPFGSEFSVFLKNLNTVRACVRITIDGKDVLGGTDLVIEPNSELNLERFLDNGNFDQGNKFKFIERTAKVENSRGIKAEDGIVRIEFEFEKPAPKIEYEDVTKIYREKIIREFDPWYGRYYKGSPYYDKTWYGSPTFGCGGIAGSISHDSSILMQNCNVATAYSTATANYSSVLRSAARPAAEESPEANEVGITVPGSVSDQKFTTVSSFPLDGNKQVIVLNLVGQTEQGKVKAAVTVKSKQKCVTCNHVNKASSRFCSECGTSLEIV